MTADLSLSDVIEPEFVQAIENLDDLDNNLKLEIRLQTENSTIVPENKRSMTVIVKNFRQDETTKRNSMICSKLLYLKPEYGKTIQWWIELNNMHGYEKLGKLF